MQKTDIDWCDMTWNPVTGCHHGCPFCFARSFATRFGGCVLHQLDKEHHNIRTIQCEIKPGEMLKLDQPMTRITKSGKEVIAPYPAYFKPTFHRYRLNEPAAVKKPRKIFVTDMGDLFGWWVPGEVQRQVFDACEAADHHRYIFLTKNPNQYGFLRLDSILTDKMLRIGVFGASAATYGKAHEAMSALGYVPSNGTALLCLEPLHERIGPLSGLDKINWVIVGAETGNRKGKVIPKREWVEEIVERCTAAGVPVFLKGNLSDVWDGELVQQYPEVLRL